MKTAADIERLLIAASRNHRKALDFKLSIHQNEPERAAKRDEANKMLIAAGTAIAVLKTILDDKPLTHEDIDYFLSDCG